MRRMLMVGCRGIDTSALATLVGAMQKQVIIIARERAMTEVVSFS